MKASAVMFGTAVLASILVDAAAAAAGNFKKLSGDQIRARFAGMQVTDEVHGRDVYERDGGLRSYSMGSEKFGKWSIQKDELCVDLPEPDAGCFEVGLSGTRVEMRPTGPGLSVEGVLQAPTNRK
jgi:hypothetical protein